MKLCRWFRRKIIEHLERRANAARIKTCIRHGHSRVTFTKKGFVYCARCCIQMGCAHHIKKHMGEKVIVGHHNKAHRGKVDGLSKIDLLNLPPRTLARLGR